MAEEKPKIIVDDDWKNEAKREKEKLVEQGEKAPEPQALPEVDFTTLVSTFMTQALLSMGLIEHPSIGRRVNLEVAKFNIDMLKVLEEKTKGNLTDDEKKLLDQSIHQVRMAFVEIASQQSGPVG